MLENYTNVITSKVEVIGLKKIDFKDKEGKEIKGIKIYYNIYPVQSNINQIGLEIDPNNYSVFIKDLDRWNEFTMIKPPYVAKLEQEYISKDKPLKFKDIKF